MKSDIIPHLQTTPRSGQSPPYSVGRVGWVASAVVNSQKHGRPRNRPHPSFSYLVGEVLTVLFLSFLFTTNHIPYLKGAN